MTHDPLDATDGSDRLAGPAGFLEAAARFAGSRAGRAAAAREQHHRHRARRVRRVRRSAQR